MENCKEAHDWYVKYFGAKVLEAEKPKGDPNDKRYIHSSIELPNKAIIFMSDRFDLSSMNNPGESKKDSHTCPKLSKEQVMKCPFSMHLHFKSIEDAQNFWDKATHEENGSKVAMKFEKQFWGEPFGKFHDTFGFDWSVGAHNVEDSSKKKKRSLCESKSSDATEGQKEENMTPSTKKTKHYDTHTKELHSHFLGAIECEEKTGIFKEYLVGKSTGYDFQKAMTEGFQVLRNVKETCKDIESRGLLSVCPEDPTKISVVRCLPGMYLEKNTPKVQAHVKTFDGVVIKTIPAGKYLVYLHAGSYEGLAAAWKVAITEFEKKRLQKTSERSLL